MNIKIILVCLVIFCVVVSCTNNSFVPHDSIEIELKKKRELSIEQSIEQHLKPPFPPFEFDSCLTMRIIQDKQVYTKDDKMKLEFRIANLADYDIIITKVASGGDGWNEGYKLINGKREAIWYALADVTLDIEGFIRIKKGYTHVEKIIYEDNEGPLSLLKERKQWEPGNYIWVYYKSYSFENYRQGQKIWQGVLTSEISFQIK